MAWTPITSHASLKTAVADWLNRGDLTDVIDQFILNAEARFRRDKRVRTVRSGTVTISSASHGILDSGDWNLTDFGKIKSLALTGTTYWGPLNKTSLAEIQTKRGLNAGTTSVPEFYAIEEEDSDFTIHFAPEPDASYTARIEYTATIPALSTGSNWLVAKHPDIYLYGALCESAPYLKDDARLPVWEAKLESLLEALHLENEEKLFGGGPMVIPFEPIGG